jgi:glutaredoxin
MLQIYTKENCPSCVKAKAMLEKHNIPFTAYVIGTDISREEFISKFPNAKTVPYSLIDGVVIGGYENIKNYYAIS